MVHWLLWPHSTLSFQGPFSLSPLLSPLTRLVLYSFPSLQPLSPWHSQQPLTPKPSGGPAHVTSKLGPDVHAALSGLGPPHTHAFKLSWTLLIICDLFLVSIASAPNNQLSSQGLSLFLVLSAHCLPNIRNILYFILQRQTYLHLTFLSIFSFSLALPV